MNLSYSELNVSEPIIYFKQDVFQKKYTENKVMC